MRTRRIAVVSAPVLALSLALLAQNQSTAIYEVVIRNGRVLDGAGNPPVRADVAIRDGRFVRLGIVPGRGQREIDAAGKYVSPGWIDVGA